MPIDTLETRMHSNVRRRLADRMWQWRNATYVASAMAVLVATVVVFVSISTPASLVEISTQPTFFDADRDFRASSDLSALYPNREIWSKQAAGGTEWYTNQLAALQIPFTETDLQATVGKEKKVFRNVAVSYTHLRAHETKANIVCRLLLEKKKKQN